MAYCTNCGVVIKEGMQFCTGCGAAVAPAAEAPGKAQSQNETKTSAKEAKNETASSSITLPAVAATAEPVAPAQPALSPAKEEAPPAPGSRYEPITAKGFFGIMFLMLVPFVNLLLLLVWALGGCRKVNKQNFAKAMLVWMLIGIGLSIIFTLAFWAFVPSGGLESIQESLFNGLMESVGE